MTRDDARKLTDGLVDLTDYVRELVKAKRYLDVRRLDVTVQTCEPIRRRKKR